MLTHIFAQTQNNFLYKMSTECTAACLLYAAYFTFDPHVPRHVSRGALKEFRRDGAADVFHGYDGSTFFTASEQVCVRPALSIARTAREAVKFPFVAAPITVNLECTSR